MPYVMRKVKNKTCYSVSKKTSKKTNRQSKKVFSKCSTRKNAIKQMRLLRALEYNRNFTYKKQV